MLAFGRSGRGDYEATNEGLRRICGAYRLQCNRPWTFRGGISKRRMGRLEVADVSVSTCSVIRDHRDEDYVGDYYFLGFQVAGSGRMRQQGSEALLRPGDCTLIDSRYASVFEYPASSASQEASRQFSLHLPIDLLTEHVDAKKIRVARTIHGDQGAGRVLTDFLVSLARQVPDENDVDECGLLMQLIAAALDEGGGAGAPLARRVSLQEVRRYIEAHLQQAELSPNSIADHFNISTRQLYRILAPSSCTPDALIWRSRLDRARMLLTDSRLRTPILDIALQCGFNDAAHFSRAYRKTFGHPPKLARLTVPPVASEFSM